MTGGHDVPGLVVVGLNHRSSPLSLREALFVEEGAEGPVLTACRAAGFAEALVLATCDRVEIWAMGAAAVDGRAGGSGAPDEPERGERLLDLLVAPSGLSVGRVIAHAYVKEGAAALDHIFSVCASLDSQVIGEPQVLGQIKAAHRVARGAGTVGGELETILGQAYGAAKRVRRETAIAEGPVSLASAALQVARHVHGDLSRRGGLVLGLGDMGGILAETLQAAGLGRLAVTAPQNLRAERLAHRLGCHVAPFERLEDALVASDIVITALGRRETVIDGALMERVLTRRRQRPVFLVDVAIPGDVSAEVDRLEPAFRYTLDDLERTAMENRAGRLEAARAARAILDGALERFHAQRLMQQAAPAVRVLRQHFENMRELVLREDEDLSAAEATRRLVNRLLHDPQEVLRESAAASPPGANTEAAQQPALERAARRLFRLPDIGTPGDVAMTRRGRAPDGKD